jgi:hypothetical protein
MSSTQHDGKCEVARQKRIRNSLEVSNTFMSLSREVREGILEEEGANKVVNTCGCSIRKKNHNDLLRLWAEAGSSRSYDKRAWLNVEIQLYYADLI